MSQTPPAALGLSLTGCCNDEKTENVSSGGPLSRISDPRSVGRTRIRTNSGAVC
jgi:hypothetical protein